MKAYFLAALSLDRGYKACWFNGENGAFYLRSNFILMVCDKTRGDIRDYKAYNFRLQHGRAGAFVYAYLVPCSLLKT